MSFPVRKFAPPSQWDRRSDSAAGTQSFSTVMRGHDEFEAAAVFVGVEVRAGRAWGKVECNPSRLVDPSGCSLHPVDGLGRVAQLMWDAANRWSDPTVDVMDARVKRLDVARDFRGIAMPSLFVRGLQPLPRPYARRAYTFHNPQRNSAETLAVGSGAGMVRLYDQHEAYAEKGAEAGSMRWEVEARGGRDGWLSRAYISDVGDLMGDKGAERIKALADERWEWSAMGTEISGTVNVAERVQGAIALGTIKQAAGERLLGQLVLQSLGLSAGPEVRRSGTAVKYRQMMKELGVRPAADLFRAEMDAEFSGRLDWVTGTEVMAA